MKVESPTNSRHHRDTNSQRPDEETSTSSDINLPSSSTSNSVTATIRMYFRMYGDLITAQPWEVLIVALVIMCGSLFWVSGLGRPSSPSLPLKASDEPSNLAALGWIASLVIGNLLALIHLLYRFNKIHRLGSNPLMYIASAYFGTTLALYAAVLWVSTERSQFWHGLFLIGILVDMPRVTRMAQFALSSSNADIIRENLVRAIYVLAPSLSYEALGKLMFFSFGFHTGIEWFTVLALYAVLAVIANVIVYLVFYPIGLFIGLTFFEGRPFWDERKILSTLPRQESQSPNVHRVKTLVITVMTIAHIGLMPSSALKLFSTSEASLVTSSLNMLAQNFVKITSSALVILITRYLLNEDLDEAHEMRKAYIEKHTQAQDHQDRASNSSTDEGISSIGSSTRALPAASRNGGADDSSSESAWSEVTTPLPECKDQASQTVDDYAAEDEDDRQSKPLIPVNRSVEECLQIQSSSLGIRGLTDDEVVMLLERNDIKSHGLESTLDDHRRAVLIRRRFTERQCQRSIQDLPFKNYDYQKVSGACCENVIGYMTMPVGVAGPLNLDGEMFYVPMATTEGCLVASVNRGCSAVRHSGVTSRVFQDFMTRGPVVRFPNVARVYEVVQWMENPDNFQKIKMHFDSTSNYARLQRIFPKVSGRLLFIRFEASTGDAMGMNMCSKGTERALRFLREDIFPDMEVISLSGNFCTDKKPAAVNWILGRGKYVVCEAQVHEDIVRKTLKTTPEALAYRNCKKNHEGSAIAGSIGGFNAQASNVVTAIYIATGQDAAQNISSSNCITDMEVRGEYLNVTVTMPSIEIGTVGGGTILDAQSAMLNMMGIRGPHPTSPGLNARKLASIVCATVLAGELSLMSALATGDLVGAHMRHNRSSLNVTACRKQEPKLNTGIMQLTRQAHDDHLGRS